MTRSARELLETPFSTHNAKAFEGSLFDPSQSYWRGGISSAVYAEEPTFIPKPGLFFIPNPLLPGVFNTDSRLPAAAATLPREEQIRWATGAKVGPASIGPIQTFFAESDEGSIEEQVARILDNGVPYTAIVLSGDVREGVGAPPIPAGVSLSPGRGVHVFSRLTLPVEGTETEIEELRIYGQYAMMQGLGGTKADVSIVDRCRRMRFGGVSSRQSGPFNTKGSVVRVQSVLDIAGRQEPEAFWDWVAATALSPELEAMRDKALRKATRIVFSSGSITVAEGGRPRRETQVRAELRLEQAVATISVMKEGEGGGRNNAANAWGYEIGGYVAAGALDEETAREKLRAACIESGLDEGEADTVIERSMTQGAEAPLGLMSAFDIAAAGDAPDRGADVYRVFAEWLAGDAELPPEEESGLKKMRASKLVTAKAALSEAEGIKAVALGKRAILEGQVTAKKRELARAISAETISKVRKELFELEKQRTTAMAMMKAADRAVLDAINAIKNAENPQIDPRVELRRNGAGRPEPSQPNIAAVLQQDERYRDTLWYDEFREAVMYGTTPVTDSDETGINIDIQTRYELARISSRDVHEVLQHVARQNKRHPVREYLRGLVWDGVERLPQLMVRGLGADPDSDAEYHAEVGVKMMISAVSRVLLPRVEPNGRLNGGPGGKVDTMVVLVGPEGRFKSSAFELLVPDPSMFSNTRIDMTNKDGFSQLRGKWIYEVQEVDSQTRAEKMSVIKAFLSAGRDNFRAAYGRNSQDSIRQIILVGTTNKEAFLEESSGAARRFVPVVIRGAADLDWLAAYRDQLWAEAVARYDLGEPWWWPAGSLSEARRLASSERVRSDDSWHDKIVSYLAVTRMPEDGLISASVLFEWALQIPPAQQDRAKAERLAGILGALGAVRVVKTKPRRVLWQLGAEHFQGGGEFEAPEELIPGVILGGGPTAKA